MSLHTFYRRSDKGNPLGRIELTGTYLESITRQKCFNNFLDTFGTDNLHVVCDNVFQETVDYIKSKGVEDIEVTQLGNTRGFSHLIDRIISELDTEDIAFICEDDYLFTPDAKEYIIEGAEFGSYTSPYDSLDKYLNSNEGGNNPLISEGGEITRVILGKKCHYKETNATTGTFAAKVKIFREDYPIIMQYCQPHFTHPYDFALFRRLIKTRGRKIMVPLPGKAFHVGLEPSPFIDWESIVKNLKED